jgi:hypothetical protein
MKLKCRIKIFIMRYDSKTLEFEQQVKNYIISLKRETVTLVIDHYVGAEIVNSFVIRGIDKSVTTEANFRIRLMAAKLNYTVEIREVETEKLNPNEESEKG